MTMAQVKQLLRDHNVEYFIKRENKNLVSIRIWVEDDDNISEK